MKKNKRAKWLGTGVALLFATGCAQPPQPVLQPLPEQHMTTGQDAALDSLIVTPHLQAYTEKNGFPEYVIGPGDVLDITLRDVRLNLETVTVRPDSNISFSLVENLRAGGLTVKELDEALTRAVGHFLKEPKIDVEVAEFSSKKVSLLGAVQSIGTAGQQTGQGQYSLKGKATVLDMILNAGGGTQDAQLDKVQLVRGGKPFILNIQRAVSTGDQSHNVILQGDDIVTVPGSGQLNKKVVVLGEVVEPNVYLLPEDASLLDALSRANGMMPTALRDDIRVIRSTDEGPKMFSVNFNRITTNLDMRQNIPLKSNDIVFVPKTFLGDISAVVTRIDPLLDLLLLPATFRDLYTTGGGLRVDTGEPPSSGAGAVFTRPLPGVGGVGAAKGAVPQEEEDKEGKEKEEEKEE